MATPLIQTPDARHSPQWFEALPPWLFSTILHMTLVIVLGTIHISVTPGNNLPLLVTLEEGESGRDAVAPSDVDLDVAMEANKVTLVSVEEASAPTATTELLTSLDTDWDEMISADSGGSEALVETLENGGLADGILGKGGGNKSNGKTSFFGLAGEGGKFVYVFDRSASMNSVFTLYSEQQPISMITPLISAKQELVRSLDALSKANEFQIVFYNHTTILFGEAGYDKPLYTATDKNKDFARSFVEYVEAAGFTNHLGALEVALGLEPDVIFLLTDGEPKDDLHPNVVRRMYKYCQQKNIVINIVHISNSPRSESTLIPLAVKTGGQHIFLNLESLAESQVDPMVMKGF